MPNHVAIPRGALMEALTFLRRDPGEHTASEALIARTEAGVKIFLGGVAQICEAVGEWEKTVRVSGSFVAGLPGVLPPGDPVLIEVRDGRLCIGSFSVVCVLQDEHELHVFDLPEGLDLASKLRLLLPNSPEALQRAGLLEELRDAEVELEGVVQEAAEKVAALGVSAEDLVGLVRARLGATMKA